MTEKIKDPTQQDPNGEAKTGEVTFSDDQQSKVDQLVGQAKAREKAKSDELINQLTEQVNSIPDQIKAAIAKHDAEANMTDKEKTDAHTKELEDKIAELVARDKKRALIDNAIKIASEKKLPQSFAKLFVGSNDDETQSNLESVETEFNKAVQERVEQRIKGGSTPQTSTGNTVVNHSNLNDLSLEELSELALKNPDAVKSYIK